MDVLEQLKYGNLSRVPRYNHGTIADGWDLPRWGNAVAGETGELCNVIKKIDRGTVFDRDGVTPLGAQQIAEEAADIVIYLDILCQKAGINLRAAIVNKFNQKSEEKGFPERLYL